ncbi:MAG: FadR family transcriptional regulator [Polaromonas sp.]|nr:FadR family transcriptional regulator [Polaromonas sp.]
MPLQPLEPKRLYRQIAEQLRALMEAGEFAMGQRLPAERDLAVQLGVSRPSVREALIALEVEGWVEVRSGSGVYVLRNKAPIAKAEAAYDEWGPLELIMARGLIEGEAAAMAAINASKEQMATMAEALAHMKAAVTLGQDPLVGDERFHQAVAQACGNEVLRDTVTRYWQARRSPLYLRLADYFERPASWRAVLTEHNAVLKAIKNRNPSAAREAMQSHMTKALTRFSASWKQANPPAPVKPAVKSKVTAKVSPVSSEVTSKPTRRHHDKQTIKL